MARVGTLAVGLAVGLVASVVLSTGRSGERTRLERRLALAEGRLAAMERARLASDVESRLQALDQRMDQVEGQLAGRPEHELWAEAQRLGIPAAIGSGRSGLSEVQEYRLALAIVREARRNGLDPLLVTAVIEVESGFDSYAISPTGALGLMQLMPSTGIWLAARRGETVRADRYLFDFERNLGLGCAYLAELVGSLGSLEAALLAYNVGPAAARELLRGGPEEREPALAPYARRVLAERERLERVTGQASVQGRRGPPPG